MLDWQAEIACPYTLAGMLCVGLPQAVYSIFVVIYVQFTCASACCDQVFDHDMSIQESNVLHAGWKLDTSQAKSNSECISIRLF